VENHGDVKESARFLLLEIPPLLRGIFEYAIEGHGECEIIRDTKCAFHMLWEPREPPDIVILGVTAMEDAAIVSTLFARWPQARVMTVTQSGEGAMVYELRPRRQVLGQMSPDEIVQTLHEAVRRSRQVSRD
jgi:DNA-binding NarL/FixJ family response regulator